MIIEGKYPNSFYNNFLIPLVGDNISFYQNVAKILLGLFCVVAGLLFKRPICDERSAPFIVHCPPWDPKKIDKKEGGIADNLKFQERNCFPWQKKTYRWGVKCQCYKLFAPTPLPPPTHSERNAWEKNLNIP